jgi:tellurite resistance protein TerC
VSPATAIRRLWVIPPGPSGAQGAARDVGDHLPFGADAARLKWSTQVPDFLLATYAGQPVWLWMAFLSFIVFLLWVDLGLLNTKDEVVSPKKSALMWAAFASLAIAFGAYVYFGYTPDPQYYFEGAELQQYLANPEASGVNLQQTAVLQYFTGYLLETALAFDNIFVIGMIFTFFAVPREYQHRVLFWGIIGAIVFRAIFISLGAAVVNQYTWVLFIFAAFLIYTGYKMFFGGEHEMKLEDNPVLKFIKKRMPIYDKIENHNFFVRKPDPKTGKIILMATPLFLALIMVEVVDIIFAVDSVPAIFAVTRDPFIVYTSNIFAILGLRSMYFMLSAAVERFKYLKYGLSMVLVLIGVKIIWNFGLYKAWKEANGAPLVPYLEPQWSLIGTLTLIGGALLFSWWKTRNVAPHQGA